MVLQGWEVKSLRAGKANISQSYIIAKNGEIWLLGAEIVPLLSASTHVKTEPSRTRKLLLHRKEIQKLIGTIERKGLTLIPLTLYWKKGFAKLNFAIAEGKKLHDKRATIKERDWNRDKARLKKLSR